MRGRRSLRLPAAAAALCAFLIPANAAAECACGGAEAAPPFPEYHLASAFIPETPSVSGGAVGALFNPASWATSGSSELAFWWDDRNIHKDDPENWGLSFGKNLGFAMRQQTWQTASGTARIRDYQIGLAGGDRRSHLGIAWHFSRGDVAEVPREDGVSVGWIHRPGRWLSYGLADRFSVESDQNEALFDVGLRPLGKPWVTLFGDYSLRNKRFFGDGYWGAGVEVRPLRGVHLGAKLREAEGDDDFIYSFNVGLTLDRTGFHVLPQYNEDGDLQATTTLIRTNPPHRGFPLERAIARKAKPKNYVPVNLENKRLTYQKDRWFDSGRVAWIDLARDLDRIKDDPRVRGVALNLSGFGSSSSLGISPALLWEFREKLAEMKRSGKEVVIHADRLGMGTYYLASVADRLTLDPIGEVELYGLALHRTYMRSFLDKMGIGIEEWRFFQYKSAMEGFARREMSDADREQLGRAVDVIYETVREGICASRGITTDAFDRIVEEDVVLTPEIAVERGLVSAEGRWADVKDWLKKERDGAKFAKASREPGPEAYPDEVWGRPREIAIVYALGECAMDTGIRGRSTSEHMRKLAKKGNVAGVVLRADSPGGDALPSDLVAEATRKIREAKKPVIVSQGGVAGSGGYWISMDGSKVLTTPVTVTGSIGVIGGWIWDAGIGEKTGFRAEGVQRGSHADLTTGIRFPFFGDALGPLPERNLSEQEHELMKDRIVGFYDVFVKKVAAGRNLPEARVRELGEGRIWMGGDAIERGLADRFGTLQDAVSEAKAMAGLEPGDEVILTEYPARRSFSFPSLGPGIPGVGLLSWLGLGSANGRAESAFERDYTLAYMRAIAASHGAPVLMVPPDQLPSGWELEP